MTINPKRDAPSRKPEMGTACNRDTRVSKNIGRWRIGKSGAGATCNKRCCEEKRREGEMSELCLSPLGTGPRKRETSDY